jgi:hypothetical protein
VRVLRDLRRLGQQQEVALLFSLGCAVILFIQIIKMPFKLEIKKTELYDLHSDSVFCIQKPLYWCVEIDEYLSSQQNMGR